MVAGLVGTGLLVAAQRPGGGPDVRVADDATASTSDVPSSPPPPPPDCDADVRVAPERVAAADVADELRVLPTWTPGDVPITLARGNRLDEPLPGHRPRPRR